MRTLIVKDEVYKRRKRTKNAEGQLICINCGSVLPKRRWLYCSHKCNMEFYRKHVIDWSVIREDVFKRDNYTCCACGIRAERMEDLECDHIIPISSGGAQFDKQNLQTLCLDCHRKKTARERGRRGKIEAQIKLGTQKQLDVKPIRMAIRDLLNEEQHLTKQ